MKVTQIRFSHATDDIERGKRLAIFSIEFDHQLLIHKISLIKKDNARGYYLVLPKSETFNSDGEVTMVRPRIYFTDKELFNEILDISIEMYKQLIDKYNGRYDLKIHGKHPEITVETALKALE